MWGHQAGRTLGTGSAEGPRPGGVRRNTGTVFPAHQPRAWGTPALSSNQDYGGEGLQNKDKEVEKEDRKEAGGREQSKVRRKRNHVCGSSYLVIWRPRHGTKGRRGKVRQARGLLEGRPAPSAS